jgi:hypothetical protein
MTAFSLRRSLAFCALSLLALFAVMTTRAVLEARAEVAQAERALAAADLPLAVSHYRLAARWSAPGNAYASSALVALEGIGKAAESRTDAALALSAYRAAHAALHSARGTDVSDPALLARVDARIAALMARTASGERDERLSEAERTERYSQLLALRGPNQRGVLLACGGFFTWVSAFAMLVLRGLDDEGRIVKRFARPSFLFLVFGWIAFAVGLQIA